MLKDITLGQYFPGNSFIHRLDPRSKLLMVVVYIAVIFLIQNFVGYGILAAFTLLFVLCSKVPLTFIAKGVKPILFFICITALFNLFLTGGRELVHFSFLTITYEGLNIAIFMVLRLLFLVFGTSVLTLTTSPIALTDGLEHLLSPLSKIRFPAHELAMMMTIALRFIPTLLEETDKIIKAQSARGADFESGNIIRRAKAMVPILIPLFISAFRRADDLATAMECRCYRGGEGRTHLKQLKFGKVDIWGWGWMTLFFLLILTANFYFGKAI
uniref:Energy-coupling factor transporter transmembrane protein EcfT n=1 Tax=uncultured Bacillota bacterium TaxID=344338 RepID=A0A650EP67_9FIRM|nr:energy-coupling factor transporter transmembrane protein EcfT [uncultured Firmicutes bacterium]